MHLDLCEQPAGLFRSLLDLPAMDCRKPMAEIARAMLLAEDVTRTAPAR